MPVAKWSSTLPILMCCMLLLTACNLPITRQASTSNSIPMNLPLQTQSQLRDFDLAVHGVSEQFLDARAVGSAWQSAANSVRQRIMKEEMTNDVFMDALEELLRSLRDDSVQLIRPLAASDSAATQAGTATAPTAGVGIEAAPPQLGKDRILILAVYPNTPAAQAGLQPHDAILAIDGVPVTYASRHTALARFRGIAGSSVMLTVRTPGQSARDIKITRQVLSITNLTVSKRLPGSNVGYINPHPTSGDVMRLLVSDAIRELTLDHPLDGLILDLRTLQNTGLALDAMLPLFVNGAVGYRHARTGKTKLEISGKNIADSQVIPLVILVSDQTVGTVESFVGILQETGRAKVVGNATGGQAAVYAEISLPFTGASVLIPAVEYRSSRDQSWYRVGIKPDVAAQLSWEEFTDASDPQISLALEALGIR